MLLRTKASNRERDRESCSGRIPPPQTCNLGTCSLTPWSPWKSLSETFGINFRGDCWNCDKSEINHREAWRKMFGVSVRRKLEEFCDQHSFLQTSQKYGFWSLIWSLLIGVSYFVQLLLPRFWLFRFWPSFWFKPITLAKLVNIIIFSSSRTIDMPWV